MVESGRSTGKRRSLGSAIVLASAVLGGVAARADSPRTGSFLGAFEVTSTEEPKAHGLLVVTYDDRVRRRMILSDGSVFSRTGKARVEDDKLVVHFEAPTDPRDLAGTWTLRRERDASLTRGTATFTGLDGGWVASIEQSVVDLPDSQEEIALVATLSGTTLAARVRSQDADESSAGVAVSYALSRDGLTLTAKVGKATETLTRTHVPTRGDELDATYTLDATGKLEGVLGGGIKDSGSRVAAPTTAADDPLGAAVEPEPIPAKLPALRATSILSEPSAVTSVVRAVAAQEQVSVVGRQDGFWQTYVEIEQAGKTVRVAGWTPLVDLDPKLHYTELDAPLFAKGGPRPTDLVQRDLGTCYFDAALIAIAREQPAQIERLVHDNNDGTVSVRFHSRNDDGSFEAHWVRVTRAVLVDEKGREHYTRGAGGVLWPALAEKAFAAWKGKGYYRRIAGGSPGAVFETLLGRPHERCGWRVDLPSDLNAARLRKDFAEIADADRAAVLAFARTKEWRAEREALRLERPGSRHDASYLERHLAALGTAGVSSAALGVFGRFYATRLEGDLGSGKYSVAARNLFDRIRGALGARRPVAFSTAHWGKRGKGVSGGENTAVVAGIAGGHSYAVIDAYEDDRKLLWIKVENPWHNFSRKYEWDGEVLKAGASGKKDELHGTFAVELSDVVRYYASADIGD